MKQRDLPFWTLVDGTVIYNESTNSGVELKFIHITKTGGSSIEEIGRRNNIAWGIHHREYGFHHEFFPRKPKQIKEKYEWFTVVRNPYDRLVSEFYCYWGGPPDKNVSVEKFNEITRKSIQNRSSQGDHWSEQYRYIDPVIPIHILKYENLAVEFNNLCKLKLDVKCNVGKNKKYSKHDYNQLTLDLIRRVYEKDFLTFGYEI